MATVLTFIGFIAGVEVIGYIGSIFTTPEIQGWYAQLKKSNLNPPSWVFGPVWALLYAIIAIAAFLIWNAGLNGANTSTALAVFVVQLGINLLWSYLFFAKHRTGYALLDIVALWISIVACIAFFSPISHVAAVIMLPYLAWVTFAGYLNLRVYQLN